MLLKEELVGEHELLVFIPNTEGVQENAKVRVDKDEDRLRFRRHQHSQWVYVRPSKVTPQVPTSLREKKLLVVCDGEHIGKFGKRAENIKEAQVLVAYVLDVVDKESGKKTGERITVPTSLLCKVAVQKQGQRHQSE